MPVRLSLRGRFVERHRGIAAVAGGIARRFELAGLRTLPRLRDGGKARAGRV